MSKFRYNYSWTDPVLPDSLWFNEITSSSANIYWNIDSLVDGYKFRYRILGQAWQGPVASGLYSDSIAEMFPFKTLSNLNPASHYEVQVKVNSLTGCEEGWSSESYFFTTQIEQYNYSVINTCNGINSGQIEFELFSENNYSFHWYGLITLAPRTLQFMIYMMAIIIFRLILVKMLFSILLL